MKNNQTETAKPGAATPHLSDSGKQFQAFGTVVEMPNGLSKKLCTQSVSSLNAILADTITLRDLYKKHHWQVAGPTFYQLHLLFDKHAEGQNELVDALAERIQLLGGVSVAMAGDVSEMTRIERPPSGREPVTMQLSRLLKAHEIVLKAAHKAASEADDGGDHGTNDLLASRLIPANEFQSWFVSQHLVEVPGAEETHGSAKRSAA
ncbi:MAG: DNA starvation/stationary phase protection protein [Bryobacteraceae bacterium]